MKNELSQKSSSLVYFCTLSLINLAMRAHNDHKEFYILFGKSEIVNPFFLNCIIWDRHYRIYCPRESYQAVDNSCLTLACFYLGATSYKEVTTK